MSPPCFTSNSGTARLSSPGGVPLPATSIVVEHFTTFPPSLTSRSTSNRPNHATVATGVALAGSSNATPPGDDQRNVSGTPSGSLEPAPESATLVVGPAHAIE